MHKIIYLTAILPNSSVEYKIGLVLEICKEFTVDLWKFKVWMLYDDRVSHILISLSVEELINNLFVFKYYDSEETIWLIVDLCSRNCDIARL